MRMGSSRGPMVGGARPTDPDGSFRVHPARRLTRSSGSLQRRGAPVRRRVPPSTRKETPMKTNHRFGLALATIALVTVCPRPRAVAAGETPPDDAALLAALPKSRHSLLDGVRAAGKA